MILTMNDYNEISSMIEEGNGTVEYEKDGEILYVDYNYEIDGYVENDYFNGTGAFVETSFDFYINEVECYNEDGEAAESNFDEYTLCKLVA